MIQRQKAVAHGSSLAVAGFGCTTLRPKITLNFDSIDRRGLVDRLTVRRCGASLGCDWPTIFKRFAYDPSANFLAGTQRQITAAPTRPTRRPVVTRGGSFGSESKYLRSSSRAYVEPYLRREGIGPLVVCSPRLG